MMPSNTFSLLMLILAAAWQKQVAVAFGPTLSSSSSSPQTRQQPQLVSPLQMAKSSSSSPNVLSGLASLTRNREENLIAYAKDIVYNKSGFYSPADPDVLDEEFVFRGPYIGPLNKADYLETLGTFAIYNAIPDINPNAWGFSVDPTDPNRVWFMVRNTGTFTGEPGLGLGKDVYFPPNGQSLQGCPETFSMIFTKEYKLKYLSVGYVADRFEGNTNGKGAAVGIFNAVGLPFPSPGPLLQFAQWFGTEVYNNGPSSYSRDNIPEWWTDKQKASEGYL